MGCNNTHFEKSQVVMIAGAMYFVIIITVAKTRVVTTMRVITSITTQETILSDAQPHLGYLGFI